MKKIFGTGIFILLCLSLSAQQRGDKLKEARIGFMKEKLALTPEEEKNFVPLYRKMLEETELLRKEFKQDTDLNDLDLTFKTDKECEEIISDVLTHKEKELEILKRYTEEYKKVLPIKKVAMIFKAEHEFKRKVIEEFRKQRHQGGKEKR